MTVGTGTPIPTRGSGTESVPTTPDRDTMWIRKECSTTSLQYSLARYVAMPASTSLRAPESLRRSAVEDIALPVSAPAMAAWSLI